MEFNLNKNKATMKAFLKRVPQKPVPQNTFELAKEAYLKRKKDTPSLLKKGDRVFTESQLKLIVEKIVESKVSQLPKPKDGETPTRDELKSIIIPLIPQIKQPKDGKDGEVTSEHIEKITSRILSQIAKTPDLTQAILNVFKEEKVKMEDIPGLKELAERVAKLAENQKWINRPMGGGYTDSDVRRVIDSYGSGLPDQTGNNGKFLTTNGTDPSWASILGGGDMLASVYDPAGEAKQVAFADEVFSGDYDDLANKPTLGTAAAAATTDFATTAQGALADTATQPSDIADFETTTELNARDTANRARANHTGTQAASTITGLATVATSGDYNDLTNQPDLTAFDNLSVHASEAVFPVTGSLDKLYLAEDTGELFRWTGSAYVGVSTDHAPVTLDGTPNYLTIVGQTLTRGLINLTSHVTGLLPFANLADGTSMSVLGRAANSSGVQASIAAGTDHHVLRRSGTSIGFGAINLAQANATTGSLPVNKGGTGAATHTSGNFLLGAGTGAVTSAKVAPAGVVVGTTDTQTLTNKTMTDAGSSYVHVVSEASSATPTATGDRQRNDYVATALVENATLAAPSGTANANGVIRYRITASGGTRTIGYNAGLLAGNITRTTSLAVGETLTQVYQRVGSTWVCVYEDVI